MKDNRPEAAVGSRRSVSPAHSLPLTRGSTRNSLHSETICGGDLSNSL